MTFQISRIFIGRNFRVFTTVSMKYHCCDISIQCESGVHICIKNILINCAKTIPTVQLQYKIAFLRSIWMKRGYAEFWQPQTMSIYIVGLWNAFSRFCQLLYSNVEISIDNGSNYNTVSLYVHFKTAKVKRMIFMAKIYNFD